MLWNAVVNYLALCLPRIRCPLRQLFLVVFVCQGSMGAQASSDLGYQNTADTIKSVRADELDYLKYQEKIEQAFELSRTSNWTDLHLQAAVIYAELLFRQERYEEQINHIEKYLPEVDPKENKQLYLLLLESKIRYLARVKQKTEAEAIVRELEAMLTELSPVEKIIVYRTFAYHCTAFDLIEKTLEHAVSGLELSEELSDHGSSGFFLQKISDAHNMLGKKEAAVDYARRAVDEYEKTGDQHLTSKSYWSLGNVLLKLSKIEGGIFYFKRALKYFKAVGMQKGIVFAQYSIANIEHSRGNYEESLHLLKDNIDRAEKAGISDMQLASMILKASVYAKQEKWDAANEVSDSILPLVDTFSRAHYKANFFMERYKLKKQTGRNEEAFDSIEQYVAYSEKHLKAVNSDNVEALQTQLELRQKEVEIQKLAQQKSIGKLQAKGESQEKTIWRLSAAIAMIMLFAFLLLVYWQLNERRKIDIISLRMN